MDHRLLTDASVVRNSLAITEFGFPFFFKLKSFWSSARVQRLDLVIGDNASREWKFNPQPLHRELDFAAR
jgi:hypothetical protein